MPTLTSISTFKQSLTGGAFEALATGVVRRSALRGGTAALAAGAARLELAVDPRHRHLPQQRQDDDRGCGEGDDHGC